MKTDPPTTICHKKNGHHKPSDDSICRWLPSGASVLAHTAPDAATAGRPMPGKVESPHA